MQQIIFPINKCGLTDNTLARHVPRKMTIWTDALYMSVPLLARMGRLTGNYKYFDDAILQVESISNYVKNKLRVIENAEDVKEVNVRLGGKE